MNNRIFDGSNKEAINPGDFSCLKGKDVVTAKLSDHHPAIHHGALFWNVMMKGKMRHGEKGISYNNGFGLLENEKQYLSRLIKVAHVIAEIVSKNQDIETIGLCEGPIDHLHVNIFFLVLRRFKCMQRFLKNNTFYKPNIEKYPNWGLLMLTDSNNQVTEVNCDQLKNLGIFCKLANRFQLWRLTKNNQDKYFALAHFPFGGDEQVTDASCLSSSSNTYRGIIKYLLNQYANDYFIFCADFNFNPYLISQWQDRALDQITHHNSLLLMDVGKSLTKAVTVDGILLSVKEKQKLYPVLQTHTQLFKKLKKEYCFFKSSLNKSLEEKRHVDPLLQDEYDKQYGLALGY